MVYSNTGQRNHPGMKRTLYILIIFLFIAFVARSQSLDSATLSKAVVEQADSAVSTLIRKDYKSYVKFIYPALVQQAGGATAMAKLLEKTIKEGVESKGARFVSATFGKPSAIVKKGNELQCTLQETILMEIGDRQGESRSTLIAISSDNGKTWKFLDTSGKNLDEMRKSFPNLSSKLIIQN